MYCKVIRAGIRITEGCSKSIISHSRSGLTILLGCFAAIVSYDLPAKISLHPFSDRPCGVYVHIKTASMGNDVRDKD